MLPGRVVMADRTGADVWVYRGAFVLIALGLFFIRLLPLGAEAGRWPGPDILLCVILAWVMRRPDYLPVWLIALVVLTEDMLLMRPPGLWTALVVLAAEFLRGRVALTRELNFAVEWLLASALMLGLLFAYRLIFAGTLIPQPGFGFALVQTLGTVICYPVLVIVSQMVLNVHKPAMGEIDARGRRL
jgi:rod shape-determining protein MreD